MGLGIKSLSAESTQICTGEGPNEREYPAIIQRGCNQQFEHIPIGRTQERSLEKKGKHEFSRKTLLTSGIKS
jgi:hypothetical protein